MRTEEVLLRLKRKYSRDEEIKLLIQALSDTQVKLGQEQAYISELEEKVKSLEARVKQLTPSRKPLPEWNKDVYVAELLKRIQSMSTRNGLLNKQMKTWRDMALSLKIKLGYHVDQEEVHPPTSGSDPGEQVPG